MFLLLIFNKYIFSNIAYSNSKQGHYFSYSAISGIIFRELTSENIYIRIILT